jgi:hypothetical protein
MRTINLFSKSILSSSLVLMSAATMAHEGHHMPAEASANISMTGLSSITNWYSLTAAKLQEDDIRHTPRMRLCLN